MRVYSSGDFKSDFLLFLQQNGIRCTESGDLLLFPDCRLAATLVCMDDFCPDGKNPKLDSPEFSALLEKLALSGRYDDFMYLYEDRWFHDRWIRERILARLGRFMPVFARKCVLFSNSRIISDGTSGQLQDFLEKYHYYGSARCKYRYALEYGGAIVAAATFSSARKIVRETASGEVEYNSYEWIRYASLPDCRVIGGMGRLLKAFLNDLRREGISPVEIMSYSDNEWSRGAVYSSLGFRRVSERMAVEYYVGIESLERVSVRKLLKKEPLLEDTLASGSLPPGYLKIRNRGSAKFLLQLA